MNESLHILVSSPEEEAARLAELASFGLSNADFEEGFDRLTRLACRRFDVSVSILSFMYADKQWFKSHIGLPDELRAARQIPRELSLCQHVIDARQPMILEDMAAHPYFREHPLAQKYGMRFYAGIPIVSSRGYALGTLCLIDEGARRFSSADLFALRDLGGQAAAELARRQSPRLSGCSASEGMALAMPRDKEEGLSKTYMRARIAGFSQKESHAIREALEPALSALNGDEPSYLYWNVSEDTLDIMLYRPIIGQAPEAGSAPRPDSQGRPDGLGDMTVSTDGLYRVYRFSYKRALVH